jgi:hypothetical protein
VIDKGLIRQLACCAGNQDFFSTFGTRKQCRKFVVSLTRASGFHDHEPLYYMYVHLGADILVKAWSASRSCAGKCLMCGRSAGCGLWFGQPVVVQGRRIPLWQSLKHAVGDIYLGRQLAT